MLFSPAQSATAARYFSPRRRVARVRASTLIMVMFTIAVLAVFLGIAVDFTSNTGMMSRRGEDFTGASALANGALDAAYIKWNEYMAANQASNVQTYTTSANFQALASATLTAVNNAAAASLSPYKVTSLSIASVDRTDSLIATGGGTGYVNGSGSQYSYLNGSTVVTSGSTAPMANVPGWTATTYTYRATAVVTKIIDPSLVTSVSRYFQQADASLFQAMLFFQNDLELHPGATMTLYGLVHTNANFYAATSASLTFDSDVSFHGNQATLAPASNYTYEDPNGYVEGVTQALFNQEAGTWNSFNAPVYATSRNNQVSNVQELYPLGTDDTTAIDPNNPNASGTHEIIERPAPISATNPSANTSYTDPDAFKAHRIWNSASLRVLINRNNTTQPVHVYQPGSADGEVSTEILPGAGTMASPSNIANQIIAAVTIDTGTGNIYDFRQGSAINADTVDMSVLAPALNSYSSFNGVLYISDMTNADSYGNTGNTDAIRIDKGGTLPTAGLTLASDGAVYVQGDYNTGTTYTSGTTTPATQPASNSGTPTQYTVPGYTTKPASIMGDAVMVLSNNWNDANSSKGDGANPATPTTFNAAIVAGQVLTTASVESGGAHNFPRFLENWSGVNFTYHGSMAELYASTHFTGQYGKANVYSAPNRLWYFDNTYLTAPPPGNLRSTTYTRGRWVRNFNQ
jgi:hypothetical protein